MAFPNTTKNKFSVTNIFKQRKLTQKAEITAQFVADGANKPKK